MKKKRVVDIVSEIATPFCESNGIELLEVEFVKEGPHRYLRLLIDKEEGVSLDDCQLVSKHLNSKLDEIDPIEENYFLEISSPGVERELKREKDFDKYKGENVKAHLFHPLNGEKVIEGILEGLKDKNVVIKRSEKEIVEIPKDKISVIRLVVNFDKED